MGVPKTTTFLPPQIENIPGQLAERPQWVCWRAVEREGKTTKVPFVPGTERRASSTDLMTWRTFSEAIAAYEAGEPPYSGIGFVFCAADPFVGIDLDNCRDPESGELTRLARRLVDGFAPVGYVEASPSGTGVHIIVEGKIDGPEKTRNIEVYDQARFFTITGQELS